MLSFLIVEDDHIVAERYKKYIELHDHNFTVREIASSAAEAEDAFNRWSPDVIVSDIQIPGNLGVDVIKSFRDQGWKGYLIFISGYDNFDYARQAIQAEAIDYLLKPVFQEDMEALLLRLKERLKYAYITEDVPEGDSKKKPDFIIRAIQYIEDNYMNDISLNSIAEYACVSDSYLSSSFHKHCGITLVDYLKRHRIRKAMQFLCQGDDDIKMIASKVGMQDTSYFYRCFKKHTSLTPGEFREAVRLQAYK